MRANLATPPSERRAKCPPGAGDGAGAMVDGEVVADKATGDARTRRQRLDDQTMALVLEHLVGRPRPIGRVGQDLLASGLVTHELGAHRPVGVVGRGDGFFNSVLVPVAMEAMLKGPGGDPRPRSAPAPSR